MPFRFDELAASYIQAMYDHNQKLNASEMQQLWYEFEYFHSRFAKKAAIEVGSTVARGAIVTGMAAAIGAIGGPPGSAMAATTALLANITGRSIHSGISASVSKFKRQHKLQQGRQAIQATQAAQIADAARVTGEYELKLISFDGYYYWPGYENYRFTKTHFFDPSPLSFVQKNLKAKIYFKPPKSGERLNNYQFIYPYLFIDWVDQAEIQENQQMPETKRNLQKENEEFSKMWEVNRFWPMLDYIFFNQSFYTELQKFHHQRESFARFFYVARFYFLTKDFYLDQFFSRVLPKYEVMSTRYAGIIIGVDFLQDFFNAARDTIHKEARPNDKLEFIEKSDLKSTLILKHFVSHMEDLSPDMLAEFQILIRSLFLDSMFSQHPKTHTLARSIHDEIKAELELNEKQYDDLTCDTKISEHSKTLQLRNLLQQRRSIIQSKSSLHNLLQIRKNIFRKSWSMIDAMRESGNPSGTVAATLPGIFGLNEFLRHEIEVTPENESHTHANIFPTLDSMTQYEEPQTQSQASRHQVLSDWDTSGIMFGVGAGTEVSREVGMILLDNIAGLALNNKQKKIFNGLLKIYGGVRLLSGSASAVYQMSSSATLAGEFLGDNAGEMVAGGLIFGPNLINLVLIYAIQKSRKILYSRMDQACISIIDRLICEVNSSVPMEQRSTSTQSQGNSSSPPSIQITQQQQGPPSQSNPQEAMQPQTISPLTLSPEDLFVLNALDLASDARMYASSTRSFQNSRFQLLGIYYHNDPPESTWETPLKTPAYIQVAFEYKNSIAETIQKLKVSHQPSFVQVKREIKTFYFYGAPYLLGKNIVSYAARATELFAHIIKNWKKHTNAAQIGSTKKFFYGAIKALSKKSINDLYRIGFAEKPPRTGFAEQDVISNEKQCYFMVELWCRATNIAFLLCELENKIAQYHEAKSVIDKFYASQNVFDAVNDFTALIHADKEQTILLCKEEFNNIFNEHNKYWLLLPFFIQIPMLFVRSIYLTGMMHYNTWLSYISQHLPQRKNAKVDALSSAFFMKIANQGNYFDKISYVSFLINTVNPQALDFQVSAFAYDAPYFLKKVQTQLRQFRDAYDSYHILNGDFVQERANVPVRRDFSDLGLGLKFTKDPALFSSEEKQIVYKDFGRVLRHLFVAAPTPKEIFDLKTKLETQTQKLSRTSTLTEQDIKIFVDDYFNYTKMLFQNNLFIYYSRVYQFIQETVRIDFFNSSLSMRMQIANKLSGMLGPLDNFMPSPNSEYYNNMAEIKELCRQLDAEAET